MDFQFLQSERFWQLFLVGLAAGAMTAFPSNPWTIFIGTAVAVWFGGSVAVGTVGKFSEKLDKKK